MKIIPRRILKMTAISTKPNNLYGAVIESKNNSITLTGTIKENADPAIFNELINKYAYASALLYFVENFNIDKEINKQDLLEDINILLHSRCRVVNEKAPLITNIGDYPLYEGENYILRGKGSNKIKESFNINEDINIDDITPEFLKNREYDDIIKGFIVCPKCKNVFEEDALITDYPDIPDDYNGPVDDDPISYNCPYCNYYTKNSENFSDAWVDDLEDAPNKDEYLSNSLNEDGTQAADIASKVDYSFQSAPTPANPGKRRKVYENIDIKDLDDEDTLNLTGFIKGVDGFYRRGNYIVVKECETGNLKVINKSKLNEEVSIVDEASGPEQITDYLQDKLNEKFPNRFKIKSGPVDDAFGLVITDNNSHDAGDLIDVTDTINAIMETLQYSKEDYEIDYKKNNLIMAIYNPKQIHKLT